MESGIFKHSYHHHQHHNLRYFNSFNNCKSFVKRTQRLIPLTREIRKAMMDFNASHSSTSISEKQCYDTFSITSLVRGEVQNILQELSISDQFIRKEEIDDLIEKCLKEKATIIQEIDGKSNNALYHNDFDMIQELEVTVEEMANETNKNKLIIENFQILEERITTLEERLSTMIQNTPKLRHIQAKKFKINTNTIKGEIRSWIERMEAEINKKEMQNTGGDVTTSKSETEINIKTSNAKPVSLYDDIYYSKREYALNLLNYKKSLQTMELNEKPFLNPYVKPMNIKIPELQKKLKQRPMFLRTNDL